MIKISEGELLDLLPAQMRYDTHMICLSYAIKCAAERILEYEKGAMIQTFFDSVPEEVLDELAVELRTQYYNQSMDIETKRKLVKNTIAWYMKAGTSAAVEELVASIFGGGEVKEWFDYNGTPGTFRVLIDVSESTPHNPVYDYDLDILDQRLIAVKRLSAHLDSVSFMVKNGIKISKSIEKWSYRAPECGTINCGTYPVRSTLGYSQNDGLAVWAKIYADTYTTPLCGTIPEVASRGYSLQAEEVVSGHADAYGVIHDECGTEECGMIPEAASRGYSLQAEEAVTGHADAYSVYHSECGMQECGTN